MVDKIRIGVVGCGYIAKQDYFPVLARASMREIMEVVALCDNVPERAEQYANQYGFGRAYTDYRRMMDEVEMDLVAILTPIPLHFEEAKIALERGVNCYIQKTMTATYKEAIELNDLSREKNLLICPSPGQMLLGEHQHAKRLIDRGEIGKICLIKGQGPHPGHEKQELYGIDPSWYYQPGGGPMMDVAVYPLTSITGLVGPAKRVSGFSGIAIKDRSWQGKKLDVLMDDNTVLILDFGEGCFAEVSGNFVTLNRTTPQVEIFGSEGVIQLGGWTLKEVPLQVYTENEVLGSKSGWYRPTPPINRPKPTETMVWTMSDLYHAVQCLREGISPLMSGEQAAHVIEIVEKGYQSARTGRVMELETTFQTFQFNS